MGVDSSYSEEAKPVSAIRVFMRRSKIILACAGLIFVGSLIVLLIGSPPGSGSALAPPVLGFYVAEPGGDIGEKGVEKTLAALSLKNPNNSGVTNRLYINSTEAVEVRVSNHWVNVQCKLRWVLDPQCLGARMVLIPQGADRCRVSLKYAGASVSFRGRLGKFLKSRLSRKQTLLPARFLAWVQSTDGYAPRWPWREVQLEAEMLPSAQAKK